MDCRASDLCPQRFELLAEFFKDLPLSFNLILFLNVKGHADVFLFL